MWLIKFTLLCSLIRNGLSKCPDNCPIDKTVTKKGFHCPLNNVNHPESVQCIQEWYPNAYACEQTNGYPKFSKCKAPKSTGVAICLNNNDLLLGNKCESGHADGGGNYYYGFEHRCWEGYENTNGFDCTLCKAGRFRGNQADSNKVNVKSKYCLACPSGKYGDEDGLRACDPCAKGTYSAGACPVDGDNGGTAGGCILCAACPSGQYSDDAAAIKCKTCNRGRYYAGTSGVVDTVCELCKSGFYAEDIGSSGCVSSLNVFTVLCFCVARFTVRRVSLVFDQVV